MMPDPNDAGAPQKRASTSVVSKRRLAVAISLAGAAVAAVTCGGTTGREGLPQDNDDGTDAESVVESGMTGLDSGLFDVMITYVDQFLPDIVAPADTGQDGGGSPWPSCPPFIAVGPDGGPVPLGSALEVNEVPGDYAGDGGEVPAPDGSPCATYGWFGSTATDNCLLQLAPAEGDFAFFPPCNWCADAGVASVGAGAGIALYNLCLDLYTCSLQTGCGAASAAYPSACLCGNASGPDCIIDAGGPCAAQELAALQATQATLQTALENYAADPVAAQNNPGYCGAALNYVFQNAAELGCFPADAAGGSP
jgi:hypothetical protein